MRFSPRTWSLLSLLLFVAAVFFWLKGNEYEARKKKSLPPSPVAKTNSSAQVAGFESLSARSSSVPLAELNASATPSDDQIDKLYPERLRNTSEPLRTLMRKERAILLANALIDTDAAEPLKIPEQFRSKGNPGSYIVQANGVISPAFRERLAEAGAEIVSYVPNNAYFVKLDPEGARKLEAAEGVQAVLPFEPYYKLQRPLLVGALQGELLPPDALLRVTLLPGAREAAVSSVRTLGAQIVGEESSPFGPQFIVQPPVDALAALAGLAEVQGIELVSRRKAAADLSRVMLGIATNSVATNYQNLSGSNIWVNINDTGIDTNHPALNTVPVLAPPAPIPMGGDDPDGHGTFVASLIAGSGAESPTNAPGSLTNADFRGIAPAAKLIALPLSAGGGTNKYPSLNEAVVDSWLIESAARTNYLELNRTNSLISNNSWTYGRPGYDSAAARYDAAVRDAIPGMTGSQPLLFVFAAGNSGFGNDEGGSGQVDSIESPGTAKNVITVGALETYRLITNITYNTTNTEIDEFTGITNETVITNYPFAALTDSSNQVAAFSSRGNVGVGIEGVSGRFKPDVVAPGTMLVAARSQGWNFNGFDTNETFGEAIFNLHTNINEYRLDSGTTFAAANVSGMLALIQEYFERLAPTTTRGSVSPALMKAILVNGARSLTELYDISVQKSGNLQGWGLPYLPNMLTSYSTNQHSEIDQRKWRMRTVEQSPMNALATGQSRTWNITLSTNAETYPLRVTLAWTDPPGNPAVGVKLVNDLDLVVTNLDTGTVFYGNDIPADADFNNAIEPAEGFIEPLDFVNNVENIAIRNPKDLGQRFSVTVRARRVNVNALPDFIDRSTRQSATNDIVQDFALVISSDIGSDSGANDEETYIPDLDVFTEFSAPVFANLGRLPLTSITNGLPLLAERIGANPTLAGTNGLTNQWNFYVFTNTSISNAFVQVEAGPYVAFVTFNPPNLSKPRNIDADIDLYVSRNSALTNLNPAVLAAALRSTNRGGDETITLTNSAIGDVFYVGVKSEDQQGAEFSLMGVSSALPFEREQNGQIVLQGVPISAYVPDGSARKPVAGTMLAIGISNRRVARITAETIVSHEDFGDLVGVLSHNRIAPILLNHRSLGAVRTNLFFDDSTFFSQRPQDRSDGPGTLNEFAGQRITGAWILEMIDNAPSHTGRVENLTLRIDRLQDPLLSGQFFSGELQANQTTFFPIEVGPGVTNLTFTVTNAAPLAAFFRQLEIPQTNAFDLKTNLNAGKTVFSFPTTNSAPLSPGTHYLALQNLAPAANKFAVRVDFGFGIRPGDTFNFTGQAPRPADSATTNTAIYVQNDKLVSRAQVSVRMDHPRLSDLAFTLISPQGGRILLSENRGGRDGAFGATTLVTNSTSTNRITAYTVFTDDTNIARLPIKFAMPTILQNRTNTGIIYSNSFESSVAFDYFPLELIESPWSAGGSIGASVRSTGGYRGTNAVELTGGAPEQLNADSAIFADVSTVPGRTYKVSFASRSPGRDYIYWTERFGAGLGTGTNLLRRALLGSTAPPENLLTNVNIGTMGGIAIDVIGGRLYSGDRRFLFRTDLVGRQRTNLVATQNAVTDVEIDPANNWVYWAESGLFSRSNLIKRARLDGRNVQVLAALPTGQINGLALDVAESTLYYTLSLNTVRDTIQAVDLATLQRRVVALLPDFNVDPFDIEFDPTTETLLFNEIGSRSFWRMPRNGTPLTRLFTNATPIFNGFAFDTASQRLYYNRTNAIYSAQQNGSNNVVAIPNRLSVTYEEIAHGIQGTGAISPLAGEIIFAGLTNYLITTPDWSSNAFFFVGRGGSERLTLRAREGSLLVDNIVVERVADTFVLPEEPLQSLVGQRSIGEWRLEVQDTRTGAVLPAGTFDWKLDLNFADPTTFAETLTGGSRFSVSTRTTINNTNRFTPGILRSNQVHYFVIQPCPGAQNLTVVLTGIRNFNSIDLLADSSGIPTGNVDTDDFRLMRNNQNPPSPNGILEFRLSDRLPAPARLTAKPIYVAIRNSFQDVTNIYSLVVSSDGNCTPAGGSSSPLLANQPEVSGLASASQNAANQMGLHSMNIPFGAESVNVSVEADADVSILAQKDLPPTTDSFSHFQDVPGVTTEQLTITSSSGVPLTPGVWYVRVLNSVDQPISYTITATGDVTDELEVVTAFAELVDGELFLSWNITDGATYEIQASPDLIQWSSIAELPEGVSSFEIEDAVNSALFYRIIQK